MKLVVYFSECNTVDLKKYSSQIRMSIFFLKWKVKFLLRYSKYRIASWSDCEWWATSQSGHL